MAGNVTSPEACWAANEHLGPLQRFLATLRDGILTHFFQPVVIFIDEIEVVRSLPFSTDEFFAAIRECYNRRATDPEMKRISFCLFGMAAPPDLIRDTRITPFNIGTRIDLTDFTEQDGRPLVRGLNGEGRGFGSSRGKFVSTEDVADGAAVGDDVAAEAPLLAENLFEQMRIGAGGFTVEAVVGAHDGCRVPFLDGGLELGKIGFFQVGFGDLGVERVALRFGPAMHGKVFGRSDYLEVLRIVALQSFDK